MVASLLHPVPGAPLTSPFGWRDGFYSGGVWVPPMFHNGVDFSAPAGAPILAMHTGRVDFNGWDGDGGWTVGIRGEAGRSLYSHMRTQSADVRVGQIVAAGQVIGRVGSSGLSTGPHVHAMFDYGSGWVDPVPFINKNNDAPAGQEVDDEMNVGMYRMVDNIYHVVIGNPVSGFKLEYQTGSAEYNNAKATQFKTGNFTKEDKSVIDRFTQALDRVAASK